jgi:hypothetical protein
VHSSLCRHSVDRDYFHFYLQNNYMAAMPICLIFTLRCCVLFMYKSLVLLGLYGRSVNVFRDGYSFRTLLCNAISKENKKQTSNKTGFPGVYCELQ